MILTDSPVIKGAITHFGVPKQLDMVVEEAAELIQAINKVKRKLNVTHLGIEAPNREASVEYSLEYHNLVGEVADNLIMLSQLILMLGPDKVQFVFERKLDALKLRLDNIKIENNGKSTTV